MLAWILCAGHVRAPNLEALDAAQVLSIVDALLPAFLVDRLENLVRVAAEVCTFVRYCRDNRDRMHAISSS